MIDSDALKPRIVVELLADGSIAIEQWINGSRKRETYAEISAYDIRAALAEQKAFIENAAERKAQAQAKAEAELHRKVWRISASTPGQGVAFANKMIGPQDYNPSAKPNPNFAPKMVPMASLLD